MSIISAPLPCVKMKILVTAHGCCFLSNCGVRDVRVSQQVTQKIPLTTNWKNNNRRKTALHERTLRQQRDRAKNRARSAPVSRHSQTLHSAWFSKHTTRLRIRPCACLKHSNFLNTDRMRKLGLSNGCSHETLLLFGLRQLSQGRVKRLLSSSNQRTGISALNLVGHFCLLGSPNTIPINQD